MQYLRGIKVSYRMQVNYNSSFLAQSSFLSFSLLLIFIFVSFGVGKRTTRLAIQSLLGTSSFEKTRRVNYTTLP